MDKERHAAYVSRETLPPESHSGHGSSSTTPVSHGASQVQKAEERYFGYGDHSDVYKGYYSGRLVAIKQLRGVNSSKTEIRDVLRQNLQVQFDTSWRHLDHPNICKIYVIAEGFGFLPALVMTYYQRGNIIQHIKKHNPQIGQRTKWVSEIADGLSYLHSVPVYHGDLRGANVFLDDNDRAVIADYGIAQCFSNSDFPSAKSTGTVRWTAAEEVIGPSPDANSRPEKIDIYAFGMTMLEIISGDLPYSDKSNIGVIFAISKHEAPKLPQSIVGNTELRNLFDACTQPAPEDRPSAQHASNVLRAVGCTLLEKLSSHHNGQLLPPSGLCQRLLWYLSSWTRY